MNYNIKYEDLAQLNEPFKDQFIKDFKDVLDSGWYILGNKVKSFEDEFANFCKSNHCIGLASGLDAITLSLDAFDLPEGSEIIVPSNTYIATILSIVQLGFKPILVEPNIATYNIEASAISEKITINTSAIIVVHLYGKCCKMDEIIELAQKHKLKVVEDCAQAHGAKYKGKMTGTFGDTGAFSFYPTKNLGALGDAGAVTTNSELINTKLRTLRNYGSNKKYYNEVIGYNSRLDEVQSAFLSTKLKSLDKINEHKRKLASIYSHKLADKFIKPVVQSDYHDVYHIYNIRIDRRDALKEYLANRGITTEIHYPVAPSHQVAMKGIIDKQYCPIANEIHKTTLSLPISYFHTEQDVEYVCGIMNSF